MSDRRDFLKKSVLAGLAGMSAPLLGKNKLSQAGELAEEILKMAPVFTLPSLPYPAEALEPFIDRQTMEIHHGKHHKAYIDKLNSSDLSSLDLNLNDADKCRSIDAGSPAVIRNNLGGHYNHSLFWQLLKPNSTTSGNNPAGKLNEAINSTFNSHENFKKEFSEKALKIFGSGWCWLVKDELGKLKICTTPNQDNPLMKVAAERGNPVLGLDVWEHAYYLKYQNKRADYIANWWSIVNWEKANELFNL